MKVYIGKEGKKYRYIKIETWYMIFKIVCSCNNDGAWSSECKRVRWEVVWIYMCSWWVSSKVSRETPKFIIWMCSSPSNPLKLYVLLYLPLLCLKFSIILHFFFFFFFFSISKYNCIVHSLYIYIYIVNKVGWITQLCCFSNFDNLHFWIYSLFLILLEWDPT